MVDKWYAKMYKLLAFLMVAQ